MGSVILAAGVCLRLLGCGVEGFVGLADEVNVECPQFSSRRPLISTLDRELKKELDGTATFFDLCLIRLWNPW